MKKTYYYCTKKKKLIWDNEIFIDNIKSYEVLHLTIKLRAAGKDEDQESFKRNLPS